jgi:hypothetical protein
MSLLDADLTCQIVDHAHALTMWVLQYIKNNDLPLADDDKQILSFHLRRINALFAEVAYPLRRNPIKPSDDKNPPPHKLPVYFCGPASISQFLLAYPHHASCIRVHIPDNCKATL